ncbi:glycosyltransferase family 4 protein [Streptomyces sp. NPDC046887]|uniref:glycosyltransferase family 4 protein n=1 Tax=Streptomyces sp. NPDC046887 TaxID=3155472 RepID=UPI0033D009A7
MPVTLVVTNDFPPRQGGIETFVKQLTDRFPLGRVVVYTSAEPGGAAHDAALPYPVVRDRARMLLPTPRTTARAVALAREHGCEAVWFGAAAPLGLMAPRLRREAGVRRVVATTHGHEVWWARTPGAAALLRRIGRGADAVTYLGAATRAPLARALGSGARLVRMVPGVDAAAFAGGVPGRIRRRLGLPAEAPVVLCAARLVPRKGQDTLIRALPLVRARVPGTRLLLVGAGPDEARLRRLADRYGVSGAVVFAGGRPHRELPDHYAAADVFAMPCRTRRAGLELEGLGIVYLEAAAAGLPVLAGRSGGAPDTVRDGETGFVVDGRDVAAVAGRLTGLLGDRAAAAAMGARGRERVAADWSWEGAWEVLAGLLGEGAPVGGR